MFKTDKELEDIPHVSTRSEAKRDWDRRHKERDYKLCPRCKKNQCARKSTMCRDCYRPIGLEKLRKGYWKWREENPEEWARIRKWLASGVGYY